MTRQLMYACAVLVASSTVLAADLYVPAVSDTGANQLLLLPNADPTNPQVIGDPGLELAGMAYDPRTNEFIARSRSGDRMYHVNRSTAAATPFPNTLSSNIGGFVYVPTVDEIYVVTEGPNGPQDDLISRLLPDGSLEQLFDLDGEVGDLDALSWNPLTAELIANDNELGLAHVIDAVTGALLESRPVDITMHKLGAGAVNPDDGLYYAIGMPGTDPSPMNTFNLSTGQHIATLGSVPNVITVGGLAFVPEPASLLGVTAVLMPLVHRRR